MAPFSKQIASEHEDPPELEFDRLSKRFGDFTANLNISFKVKKASIHGLVGENGAGKSTLMKMLFGLETPTAGDIRLRGKSVAITSPLLAKNLRIGMVHQHFMLAPNLSVLEHLALDQSASNWRSAFLRSLDLKTIAKRAEEMATRFHLEIPLTAQIRELGVETQQKVEILRLLLQEAEILIFDEPTAILSPLEIEAFLQQLNHLREQRKTILFISHHLNEIMQVCDDVSVLRKGRLVWTGSRDQLTVESLAEHMVGKAVPRLRPSSASEQQGDVLLMVKNLTSRPKGGSKNSLHNLSISIVAGEIVGLAGVDGSGQLDLVEAICSPKTCELSSEAVVEFCNKDIRRFDNFDIRKLGLAFIASDRLKEAVVAELPARDNFLLGQQWQLGDLEAWKIDWSNIHQRTLAAMKQFDVRPVDPDASMHSFSGGNQQKLVVARELFAKPKLLIAAYPTRGVDIQARSFVHEQFQRLRNEGAAVLVISSDLDELRLLSDRIFVMARGKLMGELKRGGYDDRKIGRMMGGATLTEVMLSGDTK